MVCNTIHNHVHRKTTSNVQTVNKIRPPGPKPNCAHNLYELTALIYPENPNKTRQFLNREVLFSNNKKTRQLAEVKNRRCMQTQSTNSTNSRRVSLIADECPYDSNLVKCPATQTNKNIVRGETLS